MQDSNSIPTQTFGEETPLVAPSAMDSEVSQADSLLKQVGNVSSEQSIYNPGQSNNFLFGKSVAQIFAIAAILITLIIGVAAAGVLHSTAGPGKSGDGQKLLASVSGSKQKNDQQQQIDNSVLQINRTTVINKNFTAGGEVLIQSDDDSANAFKIQNSDGSNILVADTKNKNITIGDKPPGQVALNVNGDITTNGALVSTAGYSISNQGLTIGGILVCSANGCISSSSPPPTPASPSIDVANLAFLNKSQNFVGNNSFAGSNTFAANTTFNAPIQVAGNVNSSAGFSVAGVAGASLSCPAGQLLQQAVISGGIITSGSCVAIAGGTTPSLQQVYDASAPASIALSNASGVFSIQDAASPLATNLFEVGSNGNSTLYFAVNNLGISVTGNVNTTGQYQVGGTQISSANLSNDANLAKLNATQTFGGANTFSNASNSFTGSGAGLTGLNATNISSGTLNDLRLSGNVTKQGNTFNGASQLVQLTAGGILPVLNGSNLTSLNASNISSGSLSDARLSSNVALLNANNIFLGNDSFHLNSTALTVQDAASPLGANLFEVDSNGGVTKYFEVSAAGVKINGNAVCTAAGNCVGTGGGGAIGGSGTAGKIAKFTGSGFTIGDSLLSESGSVVAVGGSINIASGNTYQINGSQISSANLSNDANLAKLNGNQSFSGNNTFSSASNSFTGSGAGLTGLNATNISSGTLNDARLSANVALRNAANTFSGNNVFSLNTAGLAVQDAASPLGTNLFEVTDNSGTTKYFTVSATALQFNGNDVCTAAGNCAGAGNGGGLTGSGSQNSLTKFDASGNLIDSRVTDDGTTITAGGNTSVTGTLTVNTITPTAAMTIGTATQSLSLQGDASTSLSATASGVKNSLVFALPTVSNKTITIPNASGTVAVSASGPLALDAAGNLSCPTCLTGGGGGGGVSSVNTLTGAITLAGTTDQVIITPSSNTLTFSLPQSINTTSSPQFTNINVTGQYKVNGSQIASSNLSDGANLAKLDGTQTFTGANTFNNAANSFTGDGTGLSNVDAAKLNGQAGSFYTNASNISSGTLNDARLSSNVALLNAANNFTGTNNFQATSATAFQIQSSLAAETLLTVDSTVRSVSGGNLIKIGNSTGTDADTTILVLDSALSAPTSNLGVLNGGLFYNSGTNHIDVIENGLVKELCNKTDLGCGSAGVATTLAGAYANGASTSDSVLSLDTTRGAVIVKDSSGGIGGTLFGVQSNTGTKYLDVTNAGISTTNVAVAAGGYISIAGGNTASRPGSPTEGMVYYDTTTKSLLVYANGKWQADRSSSTKIVAMGTATGCTGSSPVSSLNPDGADYVVTSCTSAQTQINSAITALGAQGGTVYLEEGTYIIDGSITLTSNVTLTGSGPGTIIKLKDGINAAISAVTESALSQTRFTIKNLKFDGNKANNTSGTQRGVDLTSSGSSGLPGPTVSNVEVTSFRNEGFYANTGAINTTLTNNTSTNNTGTGFFFSLNASGNNVFTGNTSLSNLADGFMIGGGNNVVQNNIAKGNTTIGFNFNGISCNHCVVLGNTSDGNSTFGIDAGGSEMTISGNIVENNTTRGIYIRKTNDTVNGNLIFNNGTDGIFLGVNATNNVVSNNQLENNTGSTANNSITVDQQADNNRIIGNEITDTAGTGCAIGFNGASFAANVYLSNNNYSGTGATSICNAPSSTIFANQLNSSGDFVFRGQSGLAIGTLTATSSLSLQGAASLVALPAVAQPTVTATLGSATTWGYKITALDGLGETAGSTERTIANGAATLDATHFNTITWTPVGGAINYKIYRTTAAGTPATTGLIGTVAGNITSFVDNGIAATTAVPVSNTSGGITVQGNATFKPSTDSATAFQVQNAAGNNIVAVDTTSNQVVLGKASSVNGTIAFANSAGANTVGIQLAGNPASSYTLLLPTTGPATGQCLQTDSTIANQLKFGLCGNTPTTTLQNAYDNSSTPATITTSSAAKNVLIKSGSGFNSTNVFQVQDASGNSILDADSVNRFVGINSSTPNAALDVTAVSAPFFDGFESSVLSPFSSVGTNPVTVSTSGAGTPHSGSFYAFANDIGNTANMTITKTFSSAGVVTYWLKSQTNDVIGTNRFLFQVDGVTCNNVVANFGGWPGWSLQSCNVTSGTHLLSWTVNNTTVGFAVDDITMTNVSGSTSAATFNAGNVGIGTYFPGAQLDVLGTSHFEASSDSTNLFQIQNAAGTNILNVDSTNLKVTLNQSNFYLTDLAAPASPAVAAGATTGGTLSGAAGTTYYYKVTALNAAGESLSSSEVSINGQSFTKLSAPGAATVGAPSAGGSVDLGLHSYKVTFVTANGETTGGTTSAQVNVTTGGTQTVPLTAIPLGATGTTQRKIYRTVAGDTGNYLLVTTIANNTTTTFNDTVADASLGAAAPASNTATTNTNNATVSWTAVTGATGYRVYRGTAAGAESAYQAAASSPFTDTGAAGTAGTVHTYSSIDSIGIGTAAPAANLDVEGTALFKNAANSTSAFQLQDSSGTSVLNVDTTNRVIGINNAAATATLDVSASAVSYFEGFESGSIGSFSGALWTASTTNPHTGSYSIGATSGGVGTLTLTKSMSTAGTVGFWSNIQSGCCATPSTFKIDGVTQQSWSPNTTTPWTFYSFAVSSGSHTYTWAFNNTQPAYWYIDDFKLTMNTGSAYAAAFNNGNVGIGTSAPGSTLEVDGTATFKLPTTSNAFQIQNTYGSQILVADPTTNSVSIAQGNLSVSGLSNILSVPTLTSSSTGGTLAAGTYYYEVSASNANGTTAAVATNPTSVTTSGSTSQNTVTWAALTNASGYKVYRSTNGTTWFVNSVSAAATTLVDNGSTYTWSSAIAPPTTNTTGGNLTVKGTATFTNASNSTSALDVQDATGDSILRVDSTDRHVGINNSAPVAALDVVASPPAPDFTWGFEDGTYGAISHSGRFDVAAAAAHSGSYAWVGDTCGNSGDTMTLTRSLGSAGYISFWAQLHGFWGGWNVFWIDGVAKITLPGGTIPYALYTYPLSAGTHTFQWNTGDTCDYIYVDDITVGTNAPNSNAAVFNGGNVGIGTTAPSATLETDGTSLFKAATGQDSASLFQVQNAAGTSLLNVDSTASKITVGQSNLVLSDLSAPASPVVAAGSNQGGTLSGVSTTTYYYKISALNAAGESLTSSEVSINGASFTPLTAPTAPTVAVNATAGNLNGAYTYKVTFVTANGETTGGTTSAPVSPVSQEVDLTAIPLGPTGTTSRKIYRTAAGGADGTQKLVTTIANNTATTYTDNLADGSLGAALPGSNTARTNTNNATVSWTSVSGATSYRVYRGTASNLENAYQTAATSPFTDTGPAGTAATTPVRSTVAQLGIGISAPTANLDLRGTALIKATVDSPTAFQVQNSSGVNLLAAGQSGGSVPIINDSFTTTPTGTLKDSATYVAGQYVQLNPGSNSNGEIEYNPKASSNFDASFQFWPTGAADVTYFYAGDTSTPTNAPNAAGGYQVGYDEWTDQIFLQFNGTTLATFSTSISTTWHSAEVIKSGTNIQVFYDGTRVINYTDITRTLIGNKWGLGAWGGGLGSAHRVRNFTLFTDAINQLNVKANSTFQASLDSSTAFQVQNAAGTTNLLTADTSNNYLQVGSATTDATAIGLVLDSYNNATDPTGTNGAMYYNTSLNSFRCYANGTWANCNSATLQNAYDNSTSPATITTSSSTKGILFKAGSGNDSTSLFQVQNSSGVSLLNVDSSNLRISSNQSILTVSDVSTPTGLSVTAGANIGGNLLGSVNTTYYYKITAIGPNGESLASLNETQINGEQFTHLSAPSAPSAALGAAGNVTGTYTYKVTFVTANGETTGSSASGSISPSAQQVTVTIPTGATGTTGRNVYRCDSSGNNCLRLSAGTTVANNTATSTTDNTASYTGNPAPPTLNTATTNTNNASVSWTAVTGATSYKIYRGTSPNAESVYFTSASSPFTDTGAAGTAGSVPTASAWTGIGIGTNAPSANLDVEGSALFKPATDSTTSFQLQSAGGTNILSAGNSVISSLVINENLTYTTPTGTLFNNATYSAGNYVQLNDGNSGRNGEIEYTPSLSPNGDYTAQYEVWYSAGFLPGNGIFFYSGDTSTPTSTAGAYGGYSMNLDDHGGIAELYYNGTLLTSVNVGINASAWQPIKFVKAGHNFKFYFNGVKIIDYTDISRTLTGTKWGLGAESNPWSYIHRVRNFTLTQDTNTGTLNAVANSSFKASVDSTSAFQVQNASGSNLLTVDTLNSQLSIGAGAVPASGLITIGTNTTTSSGGIAFGTDVNATNANNSFITGGNGLENLAASSANLYWTNTTNSTVGRANIDGTSPNQSLATLGNSAFGLAVNSSFMYWGTATHNTIGRANIDGTGQTDPFLTGTNVRGVAVDGNFIYWTNYGSNTIGRANLNGTGANQSFITGAIGPWNITVDSNYIYWINRDGNTIGRANLNGTGANQSFITGLNDPIGVAVTPSYIFWSNYGGNTVGRAKIDGTSVSQNYLSLSAPRGLATDSTYLYFASNGSNNVGRQQLSSFSSGTNLYRSAIDTLKTDASFNVQSANNSTSAFQVQNANGNNVLNVDTSTASITLSRGNLTVSQGVTSPVAALTTAAGGTLAANTYSYRVAATTEGGAAAAVDASPLSIATAASGKNTLTWTAVNGATGYIVWRATGVLPQCNWASTTVAGGSTTSFVDTGGVTFTGSACKDSAGAAATSGNINLNDGGSINFDNSGLAFIGKNTANKKLNISNWNGSGAIQLTADSLIFQDTVNGFTEFQITSGNGSAIFQPQVDNASAFQIQSSTGTNTLLNVDTSGSVITISGNTTTFVNLTLANAHFKSTQTNPPTTGTISSCGTSPSVTFTSGDTDNAGSFYLTSGSGTTGTCSVQINFNKSFGAAPKSVVMQVTQSIGSATTSITPVVTATTASSFTFQLSATDTASTVYAFYYWVIE